MGRFLGFVLVGLIGIPIFLGQIEALAASDKAVGAVFVIPIKGTIDLGMAAFSARAIERARRKKASAIILTIDTFGGRVDAAMEIIRQIEDSGLPVDAFVVDKAWSAGAMIALACRAICMKPGSSIGSATPVMPDGHTIAEKYISAISAKFQALAEKNGYPAVLAAKMVDPDLEIYRTDVAGKLTFMTAQELTRQRALGIKSQSEEILLFERGKLLNLTAQQALEYGFSKNLAGAPEDFFNAERLTGSVVESIEMTLLDRLMSWSVNSVGSSFLISLALVLLTAELKIPGLSGLGVGAVLILGFVFWGNHWAHLAGYEELLLIVIGSVLIGLEIFVIPGFGLTGAVGLVCFFGGLYFMLVPFIWPQHPWDYQRLREAGLILSLSALGFLGGSFFLIRSVSRSKIFRSPSAILTSASSALAWEEIGSAEVTVGSKGVSVSDIDKEGVGQFGIHFLKAKSVSGVILSGRQVQITALEPSVLVVREIV